MRTITKIPGIKVPPYDHVLIGIGCPRDLADNIIRLYVGIGPAGHFKIEFQIGFEIFNMFDVQNSITNTWVRDVYTKSQYAVPNYLTPRIFNLRMGLKF